MGREVFNPTALSGIKRNLAAALPFLAKFIRLSAISREVSNFFINAVTDTVQYREKNNVTRNDFMQLLIEIKNKGTIVDEEDKLTSTVAPVPTDETGKQVLGSCFQT